MISELSHQTGAWIDEPGPTSAVTIRRDLPVTLPKEGEVLVKLECTGVCHSDVHSILGHTPMTTHIAGHEGIGRIIAVGPGVTSDVLNKRVGIKWLHSYCNKCEICAVDVTYCPSQHNSGRDVPGTFQQYAISPVEPLTMIPDGLKSMVAAPLLCAGITIYSAISKLNLSPGQWLVLPGAGGGLGHLGVQIAAKKGIKVIAIDTGEEKRKLCMDLGATSFIDFREDDVAAIVRDLTNGYGAHGAVCLSSSQAGYKQSISLLRHRGTLVCVGLAKEYLPCSPFELLVRGITVVGSSVGTKAEMNDLLTMAVRGDITPIVKEYEFEKLGEVLKLVGENKIAGRAVVRIPE